MTSIIGCEGCDLITDPQYNGELVARAVKKINGEDFDYIRRFQPERLDDYCFAAKLAFERATPKPAVSELSDGC